MSVTIPGVIDAGKSMDAADLVNDTALIGPDKMLVRSQLQMVRPGSQGT